LTRSRFVFFELLLLLACTAAQSQEIPTERRSPNSQATAKYAEGQAALSKPDCGKPKEFSSALAAFKEAIELDPEYAAAHDAFTEVFINSHQADYQKQLFNIYSAWAVKYPKSSFILYQIGIHGAGRIDWSAATRRAADDYYRKALALDPHFKLAWRGLADNAYVLNNPEKQREYLKKIMEIDPSDADAEMDYILSFQHSDSPQFRRLVEEFIQHHPRDDSRVARLLLMMADDAGDPSARSAILERIYTQIAGTQEYYWFPSSMQALFEMYAKQDPEKAFEFAREMQKAYAAPLLVSAQTILQCDKEQNWNSLFIPAYSWNENNKYWTEIVRYQGALVEAEALLKKKQATEAVAILDKINVSDKTKIAPGWTSGSNLEKLDTFRLDLLKAEAFHVGGKTAKAYDYLLRKVASLPPNDILHRALLEYGGRLNKREKDVNEDVWHVRVEAPVMKDFELRAMDGKKVRLSDYRGRPVLVNFYFPTCGFCRTEFPYLNALSKNYADQGFAVLAINIVPNEDDEVSALMKDYQFLTLRVPENTWAFTNYKIGAAPENFLLDAEGRVVLKPRVDSLETERVLATEIEELLDRAHMSNAARAGVQRP